MEKIEALIEQACRDCVLEIECPVCQAIIILTELGFI